MKHKFNIDDVKHAAEGRWEDIFSSFGFDVHKKKNKPCPACGGRDRFRFDDKSGNGDYICRGCGAGDGFSLIEKVTHLSFPKVLEEVAAYVGLDSKSSISDEDRARWRYEREMRQKQQAEIEQKRQKQIALKAQGIFRAAYLGDHSEYLARKQVNADPGIKITHDGKVLIPAYDENDYMWNLQTILPDGTKLFIMDEGGRTGGCFYIIGKDKINSEQTVIGFAEGYATGMSVFMAAGVPIALSFVANNLPKAAAAMRLKYPRNPFVFFADDDSATKQDGQRYAAKAAAVVGGVVVLPDFSKFTQGV